MEVGSSEDGVVLGAKIGPTCVEVHQWFRVLKLVLVFPNIFHCNQDVNSLKISVIHSGMGVKNSTCNKGV